VEISVFYIPVGSFEEASTMGNLAVEKNLAACANVFPVQSSFLWESSMQHEQEFILLLKTFPSLNKKLRMFISSKHSYATPAILSWQAEVNEEYANWMAEQLADE
jgi:periplasmic divalent cation tolerance protein